MTGTLSNGLKVLHLHTPNDPVSAGHLFIPRGSNHEAPAQRGISTLLWSLLLKGTRRRSARQLAEDIESIGASVGGGASHDYSDVSCHAAADYFLKTLALMAETLFEPSYPLPEVEKEKTALIAVIQAKKENIFTVAYEEMNRRLYGKHPYAESSTGTEETVRALNHPLLMEWHRRLVQPAGSLLAVASDIPFGKLRPVIETLFGAAAWKKSKTPLPAVLPKTQAPERAASIRKAERFEQAYLMIGFPAPGLPSGDYARLKVLNGVLGGGMSARLFQSLREKEGLAYDVGSFYPSRRWGSGLIFYIGLQKSKLEETKKRIAAELDKIRSQKISTQELLQSKNYLKGTYILDHQTNSQRAHYLGWWEMLGMKAAYDKTYLKDLDEVTAAEVQKAARKYFGGPSVTVEVLPAAPAKSAREVARV